jgi:hypothetical protein
MNRRGLLLGFGAVTLAGCATRGAPAPVASAPAAAPAPAVVPPGPGPAELEPIYAVNATRSGLMVRVASNGCTTKADFAFFVERKNGATTVAFARRRLDNCRTIQAGHADLEFTLVELGIAPDTPVYVLNPFSGI